nr:hypothetical protein [Tanacetum cinerariifolium]
QVQEKDTVILKLKEKLKSFSGDDKEREVEREVERKVEEIETLNLELDHKVTKLSAKNEHLKQTYKQLFDSIKSLRVQSKEQCKAVIIRAVSLNPIDLALLHVDVASLVPKLRKNKTAHNDYIRHTQEEAATLREIVESERLLSPRNTSLAYASNIDSNTPVLSSTGVTLVSSASGSKSQDNTKKNRIWRTQKKAKETELEDHLRTVKSSLKKASVVDSKATSSVIKSVSNVNSNLKCAS